MGPLSISKNVNTNSFSLEHMTQQAWEKAALELPKCHFAVKPIYLIGLTALSGLNFVDQSLIAVVKMPIALAKFTLDNAPVIKRLQLGCYFSEQLSIKYVRGHLLKAGNSALEVFSVPTFGLVNSTAVIERHKNAFKPYNVQPTLRERFQQYGQQAFGFSRDHQWIVGGGAAIGVLAIMGYVGLNLLAGREHVIVIKPQDSQEPGSTVKKTESSSNENSKETPTKTNPRPDGDVSKHLKALSYWESWKSCQSRLVDKPFGMCSINSSATIEFDYEQTAKNLFCNLQHIRGDYSSWPILEGLIISVVGIASSMLMAVLCCGKKVTKSNESLNQNLDTKKLQQELEEKQRLELEEKQRLELEAKQKLELEEKQRLEQEEKQRLEQEELEAKQRLEQEEKQKLEPEKLGFFDFFGEDEVPDLIEIQDPMREHAIKEGNLNMFDEPTS